MSNERDELPDSWQWMTFGSVANVQSGTGFPKALQGQTKGELPFAKVSDVSAAVLRSNGRLSSAANYLSAREATDLGAKTFPIGTILFAKIGEAVRLNRRAIAEVPVLADNNVMGLSADSSKALAEYLFYFMQTVALYELSNLPLSHRYENQILNR